VSNKPCKHCGQPMLGKGQKRQHPDDYRQHAIGCPYATAVRRNPMRCPTCFGTGKIEALNLKPEGRVS